MSQYHRRPFDNLSTSTTLHLPPPLPRTEYHSNDVFPGSGHASTNQVYYMVRTQGPHNRVSSETVFRLPVPDRIEVSFHLPHCLVELGPHLLSIGEENRACVALQVNKTGQGRRQRSRKLYSA